MRIIELLKKYNFKASIIIDFKNDKIVLPSEDSKIYDEILDRVFEKDYEQIKKEGIFVAYDQVPENDMCLAFTAEYKDGKCIIYQFLNNTERKYLKCIMNSENNLLQTEGNFNIISVNHDPYDYNPDENYSLPHIKDLWGKRIPIIYAKESYTNMDISNNQNVIKDFFGTTESFIFGEISPIEDTSIIGLPSIEE